MRTLRYTLVADGSSDAVLKAVIEWTVREHRPDLGVLGEFAGSLGGIGLTLDARIPRALELFPCDLLIVHRDAESHSMEQRLGEIQNAVDENFSPWVPVIPIRMTEAWLLSDEAAIRSAAENKAGRIDLQLPAPGRWEHLRDPKEVLFDALRIASEKSPRALRKFNPARQRALVAERTHDFSRLRGLISFDFFETKMAEALRNF
jgi:hypothetical protein